MPSVYVIDDDLNIRDLLRIHLAGAGLQVDTFADASEGIRAIIERPPDLVLLDLVLPDLGGVEVLQALKSDASTKDVPVVVLTSRTDSETFNEVTHYGVDAFLTKPLSRDQMIGTVLNQLARRAARNIASCPR